MDDAFWTMHQHWYAITGPLSRHVSRYAEARGYAVEIHSGQRYGGHPYEYHLDQVHRIACEYAYKYGLSADVLVAAFLHDVIEDTKVTVEDIELVFGERVGELVWAVSNDTDPAPGYKERTYLKIKRAGLEAVALKLCDRIANVEACVPGRDVRLIDKYVSDYKLFYSVLHFHGTRELGDLWDRLDKRIRELQ